MASATVPLLDDTVPFGEEDEIATRGGKLPHPYVTFFHVFFRAAAVVVYMLCGWFSDSFISSFVFVVLLLSMDFWTVKNISGRILVGLRWWNYVDDQGVSHWIYESKNKEQIRYGNSQEVKIFWLALVLCPLLWSLFFIIALFGLKFRWLVLVMIALSLNGANLYGYVKCNFGANKDVTTATSEFVRGQVLKNAVSSFFATPSPSTARPTGVV